MQVYDMQHVKMVNKVYTAIENLNSKYMKKTEKFSDNDWRKIYFEMKADDDCTVEKAIDVHIYFGN